MPGLRSRRTSSREGRSRARASLAALGCARALVVALAIAPLAGCGHDKPTAAGPEPLVLAGVRLDVESALIARDSSGTVVGEVGATVGLQSERVRVGFLDASGGSVPWDVIGAGAVVSGRLADATPARVTFDSVDAPAFWTDGLSEGTTSLTITLSRAGDTLFTSVPIPLRTIAARADTTPVKALVVMDGAQWIGSWNYNPDDAAGAVSGPLFVEDLATRRGLDVVLLDRSRAKLDLAAPHDVLIWSVQDEWLAGIDAVAGRPLSFDLTGHWTGTTSVEFGVLSGGRVVFRSGLVPIVIGGPSFTDPAPTLAVARNGVWSVLIRIGQLATEGCMRPSIAGALEGGAGVSPDAYSFWIVDGQCNAVPMDPAKDAFVAEFANDGIARLETYPERLDDRLTFRLVGLRPGSTTVRLTFLRDGVVDFRTPPIPVVIAAP